MVLVAVGFTFSSCNPSSFFCSSLLPVALGSDQYIALVISGGWILVERHYLDDVLVKCVLELLVYMYVLFFPCIVIYVASYRPSR